MRPTSPQRTPNLRAADWPWATHACPRAQTQSWTVTLTGSRRGAPKPACRWRRSSTTSRRDREERAAARRCSGRSSSSRRARRTRSWSRGCGTSRRTSRTCRRCCAGSPSRSGGSWRSTWGSTRRPRPAGSPLSRWPASAAGRTSGCPRAPAAGSRRRARAARGGPARRSPTCPSCASASSACANEGMTLQAIADALNDEGVPTLRGGAKWRPSSVHSATGYRRPASARGIRMPGRAGRRAPHARFRGLRKPATASTRRSYARTRVRKGLRVDAREPLRRRRSAREE